MSFEIKPACRSGLIPLAGFYGKAGTGKTMSSLLFARGLVGPKGRICLIDSESGRGHIFADVIPGGYSVLPLDPPFSPDRYFEAFELAEANSDVVVIDSLSHEHAGEGGMLDLQEAELDRMAGDNWSKREACKMAAWIRPKLAHKRLIGRILRSRVPLICCLRGEEKTHITKPTDGSKGKVVTDDFSTPIFDPRFIFELLINFETLARDGKGGYAIVRKTTHPDLGRLLPGADEQIGIKHGEALAAWCVNAGNKRPAPQTATQPAAPSADALKTLKRELLTITADVHGIRKGDPKEIIDMGLQKLNQHLMDSMLISDSEAVETLTEERLREVIGKLKG